MAFYVIVVLVTTCFAWMYTHSSKKTKKFFMFLLCMFPSIISGLRGVGTDYIAHRNAYKVIATGHYFYADYSSILMQFIKLMGQKDISFQFSMFIVSVLTVCCSVYAIYLFKEEINFTFSIFSYMALYYFLSFNLYRQMLAVALFTLAVSMKAKKNNNVAFWIIGIIAGLVHSTAFVFLLVFFIWNIITKPTFSRGRIIIYVLGTVGVFSLPIFVEQIAILRTILPHYENYFRTFQYQGLGLGVIRYIVLAAYPAFYGRFIDHKRKIYLTDLKYLPFFMMFGTIISFTSYVSTTYIYRASYYLLASLPIYQGYLYKSGNVHVLHGKTGKSAYLALASLIVMLFFLYYDIAVLNTGEILPYEIFVKW